MNQDDAREMSKHVAGFAYNAETRDAYVSPAYVERSAENEGTFVFNANHECVGYVGNHVSADGNWLYYSDAVAGWLGLTRD
jgi:hypothetical protein